jgi:hypothetical protein
LRSARRFGRRRRRKGLLLLGTKKVRRRRGRNRRLARIAFRSHGKNKWKSKG